jgi:putative nucleotidyltransferase with HDIG domain
MRQQRARKPVEEVEIQLPEITSALSFALDLTEGADPGHALRSVLLGMRIGVALGLPHAMLSPLYYALQLKDVGCSSNAARMAQLFGGDDRDAKAMTKLTDWTGLLNAGSGHTSLRERMADLAAGVRVAPRNAERLWSVVLPGGSVRARIQRIAELGKNTDANTRELIKLRCDRGASILRKLRMSDLACESVRHLDERWDGSGYPDGLSGHTIPVLARIAAIAQNLDVFATAHGVDASIATLGRRSGTWFDPEIVKTVAALHHSGSFWTDCEPGCSVEQTRQAALDLSPEAPYALRADEIDAICEAFADVVDAKSPFTFRHSLGVTEAAVALARELGLSPVRQKLLQRAGLLHDLGKLGVSNSILDKPGPLTPQERQVIGAHPGMTRKILSRITGFAEIARVAGEHHERLDGSGYPDRLPASALCLESRVLAMADCFAALAEERPYRSALPTDRVLELLRSSIPTRLDPEVFAALEGVVGRRSGSSAVLQAHVVYRQTPLPELVPGPPLAVLAR